MYENYNEEYLSHYGVKGMKWGIRKDVKLIANAKRNRQVRRIKDDYERGRISIQQKNTSIEKANKEKKRYITDMEKRYTNAKSQRDVDKLNREVSDTAIKEVNNRRLKKGVSIAGHVMTGLSVADVTAGAIMASTIMPVAAPLALTSAAVSAAAAVGLNALGQMGLDKLS